MFEFYLNHSQMIFVCCKLMSKGFCKIYTLKNEPSDLSFGYVTSQTCSLSQAVTTQIHHCTCTYTTHTCTCMYCTCIKLIFLPKIRSVFHKKHKLHMYSTNYRLKIVKAGFASLVSSFIAGFP